jgi:hypothetical protein
MIPRSIACKLRCAPSSDVVELTLDRRPDSHNEGEAEGMALMNFQFAATAS